MVSWLACSINGADITVAPTPDSHLSKLHGGAESVVERTTCNYGLNPDFEDVMSGHGMRVGGRDDLNEVRAVELIDHPFFVATLYLPQLSSTVDHPHPIFTGLVAAAAKR